MAIKWGNTITGSKSTRKGKIGIDVSVTSTTNTKVNVSVKVYFASMYSLNDTNNEYYYNSGSTSATKLIGSRTINHTVNSGSGWDSSNVTELGSSTYEVDRGTSEKTQYYAAKITGIDNLGSSNVSSVYGSALIPALPSYTVTYNANGGTGAPSKQTKWYGTTLKLSTTKPTRTGYTFQGWGTSASDTSVDYAAGANYTGNANITLYAIWKANTFTVSYNANGGSGAPGNQTKTYGVTLKLSTTKPTRPDYNFKGWATSANGSVIYAAGANYTGNANITLYAVWELAYVKPRITGHSVSRCNSDGTITDTGKNVLVKFNWACDKTVSSIKIYWRQATATSAYEYVVDHTTGNSVSHIIGNDDIDTDHTYIVTVTVTDAGGNSSKSITLPGTKFIIDILNGGNGIAFGKPSEHTGYMDVDFKSWFRKASYFDSSVTVEGRMQEAQGHYISRNQGTPGTNGYFRVCTMTINRTYANAPIAIDTIQRNSTNSYYIWFGGGNTTDSALSYLEHSGSHNRPAYMVKTAASTWTMYIKKTEAYDDLTVTGFDKSVYMDAVSVTWHTDQVSTLPTGYTASTLVSTYQSIRVPNGGYAVYGQDTSGNTLGILEAISVNNNIALGYELYNRKIGNTHIYGHDIIHYVSNIATPGYYRPYRRKGDVMELSIRTAGYVTNDAKEVHFFIPFSEPIVGAPTVTVASGDGFVLRQWNNYTHGSSSSVYVQPTSYKTSRFMFHGINVIATFSSTANATNNAPIGIYWNGTITFS